jgi:hypothetical protein
MSDCPTQVVSSPSFPVIAYPKPWTPGTTGSVTGDAVIAVINTQEDIDKFKGKLRGKYVLSAANAVLTKRRHRRDHRTDVFQYPRRSRELARPKKL